jgi:hypothetical protein
MLLWVEGSGNYWLGKPAQGLIGVTKAFELRNPPLSIRDKGRSGLGQDLAMPRPTPNDWDGTTSG